MHPGSRMIEIGKPGVWFECKSGLLTRHKDSLPREYEVITKLDIERFHMQIFAITKESFEEGQF